MGASGKTVGLMLECLGRRLDAADEEHADKEVLERLLEALLRLSLVQKKLVAPVALSQIKVLSRAVDAGFDDPALAIINQLLSTDSLARKTAAALRKTMPMGTESMTAIL